MSTDKTGIKKAIAKEVSKRRLRATPKTEGTSPTISVKKMYKSEGSVKADDSEEELVDIELPHPEAALSQIGYNARMTINLGDFESVQIGVSCVLPCYLEEIAAACPHAKHLVDIKLNKEVSAVREFRKEKSDR